MASPTVPRDLSIRNSNESSKQGFYRALSEQTIPLIDWLNQVFMAFYVNATQRTLRIAFAAAAGSAAASTKEARKRLAKVT